MLNVTKLDSFRLRCFIVVIFMTIIQVSVYIHINNEASALYYVTHWDAPSTNVNTRTMDDELQWEWTHSQEEDPLDHVAGAPTSLQVQEVQEVLPTKSKWKPFNLTNPFQDSWCPKAECHNSPICTPCHQRFLFILATGRSGSTSLLKMLNQLPNVRLSGENYNILYEMSKLSSFFDKTERKRYFLKKETRLRGKIMHDAVEEGPFQHNAMPVHSMACVSQKLLRTINPPKLLQPQMDEDEVSLPYNPHEEANKIIGAKLIRIPDGQWSPIVSATFFQDNFPCSKFIVNIRSNQENQMNSMSSAFEISEEIMEEQRTKLENHTAFLKDFQRHMGDEAARLIDMSQWKDDIGIINELLDWLGFNKDCHLKALVHENHHGYQRDKTTDMGIGENCRLQ